jgi:hypothetical protein
LFPQRPLGSLPLQQLSNFNYFSLPKTLSKKPETHHSWNATQETSVVIVSVGEKKLLNFCLKIQI